MRKFIIVLVPVFCFFWLSACDLFNQSIPKYINKYTNTAAPGNYNFVGSNQPSPAPNGSGKMILIPGVTTEIVVNLRNAKSYNLHPYLQYLAFNEDGSSYWFPGISPETVETGSNSVLINSVPVEATFDHNTSNIVKIRIGDPGASSYPAIGDEFRLRLSLREVDTNLKRQFEEDLIFPVFKCNTAPSLPSAFSIKQIEGTEDDGLTLSWSQTIQNNDSDANYMEISCPELGLSKSYSREFDTENGKWGHWKVGGSSVTLCTNTTGTTENYSFTEFKNSTTAQAFDYNVYLTMGNSDGIGMDVISHAKYTGTGDLFYVSAGGTLDGSTRDKPTTLPDAISIINGRPVDVPDARIIIIKGTEPEQMFIPVHTIKPGKTITILGDDNSNYSIGKNPAQDGSLFTVSEGAKLVLKPGLNGTLSLIGNGIANNMALVTVRGTFEIENNVFITNNENTNTASADPDKQKGGGVFIDGGSFVMNGGEISGNTVTTGIAYTGGGGVFIDNNGSFIMKGGSIHGNTVNKTGGPTSYGGGGVYINKGTFTMEDNGKIYENISGENGGGVLINENAEFKLISGEILQNTTSEGYGGGVYLVAGNSAKFTMSGGKIINNGNYSSLITSLGGGVYMGGGVFNLSAGEISGNMAKSSNSAGGIHLNNGTCNISGGTISSNKAAAGNNSRGIQVNTGTLTLYNNVRINTDNTVYIENNTNYIRLASNFATQSVQTARIELPTNDYSDGRIVISGNNITNQYMQFDLEQPGTGLWAISDSGKLSTAMVEINKSGTTQYHFDLKKAIEGISGTSGAVTLNILKSIGVPSPITLASDAYITLDTPSGNNIITFTGSGSLFRISSGATLTLGSSTSLNTLSLKGPSGNNTAALITVDSGAILNMYDKVVISGNTNYTTLGDGYFGGAVCCKGTFNMHGGIIGGSGGSNKSYQGGGVYVYENSTFTMYGGDISHNEARNTASASNGFGGGVYSAGTFIINGGTVGGTAATSGNSAKEGGGVYISKGTCTISSEAKINYNKANDGRGGGVYIHANGKVTMNLGNITANEVTCVNSSENTGNGGGVYSAGEFYLNNGTISKNFSSFITSSGNRSNNGGGVYSAAGSTFVMKGGTIGGTSTNTADGNTALNGAGVFLYLAKPSYMYGGNISYNETLNGGSGGGIYVHACNFTMAGKTNGSTVDACIEFNTAKNSGGGACVNGNNITDGAILTLIGGNLSRIRYNTAHDNSGDDSGGVKKFAGGKLVDGGDITGNINNP